MEGGGDDLFIINGVEGEQTEELPDARPQATRPQETEAEVMESVKGLVPLCALHADGPQLSSATFGYDIAQMEKRPWSAPGAKLSDYFNYGFNEQSWRMHCAMQEQGEASLLADATAMLRKLELAGRSAGAAEETGAGGPVAAAEGSMAGGGMMEGYGGGGGVPYGGGYSPEGPGRVGYSRPFFNRDFATHGGPFERPHNANYKTRLCKGFAEGFCHRGDQCHFAHGPAELRQATGGPPMSMPMQQQPYQPPGPVGPGGAAPSQPPMPQAYGEPRQEFQAYYPPAGPMGGGGGGGSAAPERVNYLMPPMQPGVGMPPMMGPPGVAPEGGSGPGDGAGVGGGFRQPPKRPRHDGGGNGGGGGGVYEPQY